MFEGNRATAVTWVVAAVLATLAISRLVGGAGADAPPPVEIDTPAPEGRRATAGRPDGIWVHVAGAVRSPGLVRVAAGARIAEAIARAGGPRPRAELTSVNLAAKLADGQQVVVPLRGAAPLAPSAAAPGSAATPGGIAGPKPSLATVTLEQLDALDGIGPTLAGRILEYRAAQGGFRSLEELGEVDGIGEKRLAALKEALAP